MRFMSIHQAAESDAPPTRKEIARMGPFVESREVIGGFAIIECESGAHAIELGKRYLEVAGGDGVAEIRQMFEGPGEPCSR